MEYEYVTIEELLNHPNDILAHLKEGKKSETLLEHMNTTKKYLELVLKDYHIDKNVKHIIENIKKEDTNNCSERVHQIIFELFINGIYLHDIGKINPNFQALKMSNNKFQSFSNNSKHALLSAIIYQDIYIEKMDTYAKLKDDEYNLLFAITHIFAYLISRHHTHLNELVDYIDDQDKITTQLKHHNEFIQSINIDVGNKNYYKNEKEYQTDVEDYLETSEIYILARLFYSLLIACDYYATYDYMSSSSIEVRDFGLVKNVPNIKEYYHQTEIMKKVNQYFNYKKTHRGKNPFSNEPINALRSDMLKEATDTLNANKEKNIFYLEAPTGSGKTNISINLALNILEQNDSINKIMYIFPFNTLVDQTFETLTKSLGEKLESTVVNAITPIKTNKMNDEEAVNYDEEYLNYLFLHYPLIITTHVRLFNMLFGCSREENIPLMHLANSVIIIDEVQSYKIKIWKEIIYFFDQYSQFLNIKIIIMSATLPKLDELLKGEIKEASYSNLIKNREAYFMNPLFRDRVALDYSLLDGEMMDLETKEEQLDFLLDKVDAIWKEKGKAKILIEFLTTNSARAFYDKALEKHRHKEVFELTGSDNKNERMRIIDLVRNKLEDCLLITTQVIEAGVDIDMDIGFKSISFLDAEEQFLGRINRSCKRKGRAYFFDIDEAKTIYKGDFRLEQNLHKKKLREVLETKEFSQFYQNILEEIDLYKNRNNDDNFRITKSEIIKMRFSKIYEKMRLIDNENTVDLFVNGVENINGKRVKGKVVWDEYKKLLNNNELSFGEKKIKLSAVKSKMNYFIYTLYIRNPALKRPSVYEEEIGELYFIDDEQALKKNGKFNKMEAYKLFNHEPSDMDFL
ncbi:CRISPR-associated helicase Cas3' [Natranaerovirga hydrolytica]|nr:CRISPR-associated helicase Cas3' [Natranaerovirga hydrolytica]